MEQIEFYCAVCGDTLPASPDSAEVPKTCPACSSLAPVAIESVQNAEAADGSEVFVSELLSIEIRFRCGACRQKFQVDVQWAGMILDCPLCRALTKVPKWSGAPAQSDGSDGSAGYLAQLTQQEVEFLSAVLDEKDIEKEVEVF
jgi:DNA-directed RNA polymerase subunit RPC12/RpoP